MKERFAAVFAHQDARRVDSHLRRDRRLRGAGALAVGGAPAPAQRGPSTFVEVDGAVQPAPAPRFCRTPSAISKPPSHPGADTVSGLVEWGIDEGTVSKLRETGALA